VGKVRHLGELVVRVDDLEKMRDFYENVVGLELFCDESDEGRIFLKAGDAVDGHPQLSAIFVRPRADFDPERKIMDHFAFVIDVADYTDEFKRLESLGVRPIMRTFPKFGWRSFFFLDPEGNAVEFVSADPSVKEE